MASRSKEQGGNNCPTSDRDGKCVDKGIDRQTFVEIESTNGRVFMPTPADREARDQHDAEMEGWDPYEDFADDSEPYYDDDDDDSDDRSLVHRFLG